MSITAETIALTHAGRGYSISAVTDIASAGNLTFTGTPGNIPVHFHDMNFDADAGPVLIEFIESPTISVAGTIVPAYNRRRDSVNTHKMVIRTGATVTGGTVLASKRMYGDSTGSKAAGEESIIRGEWDLNPSRVYAIRITNETDPGATINISAEFSFYEQPIRDNYDVVPTYER